MNNAEEYLKNYELDGFRGKSETTKKTYLGVLSKFNNWLEVTGTDISDFTFVELQQYMDHLKANDAKASTINKEFNAIKHYCRFIGKAEIYEYVNVMKQSKSIQAPKALPRNERNAMLREANRKSARDYAIVCMLLYTGVRVEECSNLKIKHLFDIGEKSGYVRVISKGNKERVVPLNSTLRQALTIYFKERGIDFYNKAEMEQHKQEPVFISTHNKNVSVRRIQQLVKETGNTHPHTLRHTFATVLLREKGYDIVTVAQLMGHGSLNMLQKYTAASKEDMLNMVENFDT